MAAAPEKTPYEVLGVPRTATQDEIKKRYREMARKYHPDVNQNNPSAAQIFGQMTQAYKSIGDPDSRKMVDAEITLKEQREQRSNAARYAPGPNMNGGGAARPTPGASARTPQSGSSQPTAASYQAESIRLTAEARAAFLRDRPVEARNLAEQAIRLNRRSAEAWEVLGDVFRRQGRSDEAVNAYSMSLQINPRNASVMQRLERMARASSPPPQPPPRRPSYDTRDSGPGPAGASSAARPGAAAGYPGGNAYNPSPRPVGRVSRMSDPDKRPIGVLLAGVVGYGAVFMTILYCALYPGNPPPFSSVPAIVSWVSTWNATIVTTLALCGLILGATMTITGAIRRIDDELILSGVAGRSGTFMPLGLLLTVLSVVNFYFAAIIYALITVMQESFTQSMMRVLGAVTIVVLLLASTYSPGHMQVFLFGGNIVFITFIVGWLLGDFFRPVGS